MKDLISRIEGKGYVATEQNVEEVARAVANGARAGVVYLRIMVAAVQKRLGRGKADRKKTLAAINAEHQRLYPIVQRALGAGDVQRAELHRRCIFARTATTTLRAFAATGGNVRKLALADVTKRGLRHAAGGTSDGRTPSVARLLRYTHTLAGSNPGLAKRTLQEAIDALTKQLQSLDDEGPQHTRPAMGAPVAVRH